jgi:hypothetical protein
MSAKTVTWTPTSAGMNTLYAEAFTGTSPGNRQYGISGWPGYEGGTFGGLPEKRITASVRNNPSGSVQVLDASFTPVALNNGVSFISHGSKFYLKISGSDPDGDAEMYHSRVMRPGGLLISNTSAPRDTGTGGGGSKTFGPFTANVAGDWQAWGHVADATARSWNSVTPWNENGNGWWSSPHYILRVNMNPGVPGDDGVPAGLSLDSNGNDIPDYVETLLGFDPTNPNNNIPNNIRRLYQYDYSDQLLDAPEGAFELDPEGNVKKTN